MKVLLCDDDPVFATYLAERIQNLIPKYCDFEIKNVTTPSHLDTAEILSYDIMFLDIDMGDINGINLARIFRKLGSKAIIVFITNYIEYSPEGYEVHAFRFLMKSQLDQKLSAYLCDAVKELSSRNRSLRFSLNGEPLDIHIHDLLYLESRNRKIYPHTIDYYKAEYMCFYSTLDHMEEQLNRLGFLRVHKSFLVNMSYICRLRYDQVQLCNGTVLPVSERRYSELRERYLSWKLYQT